MTPLDPAPVTPHPSGLSVLFICTGNICRSPFAELLLRARVPGLSVASRGIHALQGQEMEQQMAAELGRRGVSAGGFFAQQVAEVDLQADLVLTMSRRQRAFLIEEYPAAARRTGLVGHIPQLAQLTEAAGSALNRDLISQWSRQVHPAGQEVQDPYRRPPEIAAATAEQLESLVERLAVLVTGRR